MQRHQALVCAVVLAALASTPTHARQKTSKNQNTDIQSFDQHAVDGVRGPAIRHRTRSSDRRARRAPAPRQVAHTSRDCLHHSARSVLDKLEARFGRVTLVSTCRPGARMPSGHVSLHALNRAFDFNVGKGIDKRDVMVWLGKNSPGVTMSYAGMSHIHTDTGSFHKVIYNAASHQAGERAVAIWRDRERRGIRVVALPPHRPRKSQARVLQNPAPWTSTAAYVEPDFEYAIEPPADRRPEPIATWGDRVGIFQRYFESKDVVVAKHTSLTCPNGQPFPARLAQLPKDAAAHFGRTAYINSGYRTPERNRRVGGARNSEHKKCKAIDWRVAGISVTELRRWVMARLNQYGIGGLGTYGTHLHTDARKATKLVTWTGGRKKSVTRYAKHRKPSRYASAG